MNRHSDAGAALQPARLGDPDIHSWITWMTCCHEHAVTNERFAAGILADQGTFGAVCGHLVTPGALVSPPGLHCPRCQAELHQWAPPPQHARRVRWLAALSRSTRQRP